LYQYRIFSFAFAKPFSFTDRKEPTTQAISLTPAEMENYLSKAASAPGLNTLFSESVSAKQTTIQHAPPPVTFRALIPEIEC